jgi:hypothetical protein
MAAWLEQAAALDRKKSRAADRQLGAELFCGEPGARRGYGSRGCRGEGSGGRYPGGQITIKLMVVRAGWPKRSNEYLSCIRTCR